MSSKNNNNGDKNFGETLGNLSDVAASQGRGNRAATASVKELNAELAMKLAQYNGHILCNTTPGHESVMLMLGRERIEITGQSPSDIGGFAGGDKPLLRSIQGSDKPGQENIRKYGPSESTVDRYIALEKNFLSNSPAPIFQMDRDNCAAFIRAAGYTQGMDSHSNPTWSVDTDLKDPEGANKRWCTRSPFHGGTINPGINKNALGALQIAAATIWMRLSAPNIQTGDPGDRAVVLDEYYVARRAQILGK